jgi:hypothetical protein
MKKLTQAEFLAKAVAVHGVGRYDYSQTVYRGSASKVEIVCPQHGAFIQNASNHMLGRGCKKCAVTQRPQCLVRDVEYFIKKARDVHGEKYDYSAVEYVGVLVPVKIICPEHGAFKQTPTSHTNGNGCSKCHRQKLATLFSDSVQEFIRKAQLVHGNRYSYTQALYVDNSTKVKIICPEHGAFEQTPGNHKSGLGCPICAQGRKSQITSERNRLGWAEYASGEACHLYLIRLFNEGEEFYKIGVTKRSVPARYRSVQMRGGYDFELLALHTSLNSKAVSEWEQSILETFAHLRYRPKQPFGGATECFSSCEEILSIFPL